MVEVRKETLPEISGLLSRSHPTVRSPFRTEAHYCGTIFRRICEQWTLPLFKMTYLDLLSPQLLPLALGNVEDYV